MCDLAYVLLLLCVIMIMCDCDWVLVGIVCDLKYAWFGLRVIGVYVVYIFSMTDIKCDCD